MEPAGHAVKFAPLMLVNRTLESGPAMSGPPTVSTVHCGLSTRPSPLIVADVSAFPPAVQSVSPPLISSRIVSFERPCTTPPMVMTPGFTMIIVDPLPPVPLQQPVLRTSARL